MSDFRITDGKGFGITFENGWTVSVQFGPGNYCEHYDRGIGRDEERCGREGSFNAETAVIEPGGKLIPYPDANDEYGTVQPRQTANQVLETLKWAAAQAKT